MLDRKNFLKGMGYLTAAYPDYEVKPETAEVYWERLNSRFTPQEWEAAVNRHIDTCKWFPKVSELFKAAEYLRPQPPSPIDAWNLLIAAASSGEEPEMDQATRKAMDFIGGWEAICYTPTDQHRFMFAQFKLAFIEAQERERKADGLIAMVREQAALPEPEG
jgi:hypothetical protein